MKKYDRKKPRKARFARFEQLEARMLLASATISDTSWGAVGLRGDGTYITDTLPHAGHWDAFGTSGDVTWRGWDKYTIPTFSSRPAVDRAIFPWSLTAEDDSSVGNWGGGDFRGVWSDPQTPTSGSTWDGMSNSSRYSCGAPRSPRPPPRARSKTTILRGSLASLTMTRPALSIGMAIRIPGSFRPTEATRLISGAIPRGRARVMLRGRS